MIESEKQSILIVDGDVTYCDQLCTYLKRNSYTDIDILQDCSLFAEYVKNTKPIVIIMDMILPSVDGLQLLKQLCDMKREGVYSSVIVVSAFYNDRYIRDASMLGAYSYLIKPVKFDVILDKVNEIKDRLLGQTFVNFSGQTNDTELLASVVKEPVLTDSRTIDPSQDEAAKRMRMLVKITKLLHDMGIPAHLCGHDYLRDAIIMVMDSHEVSGRMTKEIYPEIANKYKKSPQSVERAIRTALDVAWTRGKTELINDIFRFTVNIQKGRPTNSEFVSLIADYLNYDYAGVV